MTIVSAVSSKIEQAGGELRLGVKSIAAFVGYIKRRLAEPSTWAGITTATLGAGGLSPPLSWLCIGCGVIMVLLPASEKKHDCEDRGGDQ